VQATLGILTLLYEVPISLGLVHQAVAILVVTLAVMQAERLAVRQGEPEGHRLGLPLGQTN
jgi:cytochrome c oxidase assembly protein subunit 15